jgi:hypothetical protein
MNEHRSRFKAYLISHRELIGEAEILAPSLREFQSAFERQEISAAEWATLFVFIYLQKRSGGNSWWMKKSNSWAPSNESSFFLSHWFQSFQIKKLPDSVSRALYSWLQGKYAIRLQQNFISPYEMLQYQARGERVVTLSHHSAVNGELVDGARDAFEFLLHDLVHADLFFSSPENFLEQKSFFSSLLRLLEQGLFVEEQKDDVQFREDFNYLISDMNSHPAHLAAMLKASYIKHLLAVEGKAPQGTLSADSQRLLAQRLHHWQSAGRFEFQLT